MIQEAIQKINWQPGKVVHTEEGPRQLSHSFVPDSFWGVWRLHKEKIKEQGIRMGKNKSGRWILTREEKISLPDHKDVKIDSSLLLDYQVDHTKILIQDMINYDNALDASDTGTGKTYIALAIARHFNIPTIILVPKSSIPKWKKLCKQFKVRAFVSNYEQFKNGNTEHCKPYTITKTKRKKDLEGNYYEETYEEVNFDWIINLKTLVIFDEAHRCKNKETQNSRLLTSVLEKAGHVLCLSATIADNPLQMYAMGIALGLFEDEKGFYRWCYKRGVSRSFYGLEFSGTKRDLLKVHNDIFPHHGHRISVEELGDKFPENLIISDAYQMDNSSKIQSVYNNMYHELKKLKNRKKEDKADGRGQHLVEKLRARQEIELLKVPTFTEMAQDLVEEGMSVAVFLNFEESVQALSKRLKTKCLITGNNPKDREKNRIAFQKGKERIIILNNQAGGESIDLHDEFGNYPRVSLISPTYSAQNLKQILGRLPRAGAKSKVIQKIIFAAGTVEEEVADKVAVKIKNIATINDGDLE